MLFLFFAPLHWSLLLSIYAGLCAWTAGSMFRKGRADLFRVGPSPADRRAPVDSAAAPDPEAHSSPFRESLLGAALAIYPLLYIMALFRNIGELGDFSIRLPSDVYTDALLWMVYGTPLVLLAGAAAWKAGWKPGLRMLIYLYGSVVVVLAWILVWERLDLFLAGQWQGPERETLFFDYLREARWRAAVKILFYGGSFVLGTGYLAGSRRTGIFLKRALFLGLPSMLIYANMLFILGDWNYDLAGMRDRAFLRHDYGFYRFLAAAQTARTPSAYRTPFILEEWAELEYQSGDTAKAAVLLRKLSRRCAGKPYYARMGDRTRRALQRLGTAGAREPALQLDLPIIKRASYLDREWYALLSAVAYLKPDWTDLELKKRLLELSNTVQLHLPELDNVPELIPALRQLELPVTTCFLTADRMKAALAAGHVPFLSVYGHWVPISGYDPGRDGFYYYAYEAPGAPEWYRNEDTDLFYHHAGERFGGEAQKRKIRAFKYSLQKFIPTPELEAHLLDIGGVGMVLGDSGFAGPAERKATFLLEKGDVYSQDYDNYREAAEAYRQAAALHPCDQAFSRIVYLKRRFREAAGDPGDYRNLFQDYPPAWMDGLGPAEPVEKEIVAKIMAGKLGSYLMMNWYATPMPDTSAESRATMDTALAIFRTLHRMEPYEPIYLDSLASLLARKGDLAAGGKLYAELAGLYPFGSESAAYRLAWIEFKLGKLDELPGLLDRCESFAEEARYLTMKGAYSMHRGNTRRAFASLSRSLKLDKSIPETHTLLADYYKRRGDERAMQVHLKWRRRSI